MICLMKFGQKCCRSSIKAPTRITRANCEQYRAQHEHNIKGAKYDVTGALKEFLTILKFLHYHEQIASNIMKVGR